MGMHALLNSLLNSLAVAGVFAALNSLLNSL